VTLEKFLHVAGIVPNDLVLVRVELPDEHSGEEPELTDLPGDWNLAPPGPGSMAFGSAWARANRSLILYVPSVLVPEERNAILNPNHPEFAEVRMRIEREFQYDPRMYLPRREPRETGSRRGP
jgi:RES domain-containing protein